MTRYLFGALLGVMATTVGPAAHHSISGVYDASRSVTIDAVVTEFRFVNPHPYLLVRVQDGSGEAGAWRLEMDNRGELSAVGVTAETLKPGDRLVVTGSQSRTEARSLYVRKLVRAVDGFELEQVGNSPRVRTASR